MRQGRQDELFGWQIINGGLRNLREKKKKKWKIENFEVGNLQYGIYFKFGSLPNYYDDDWLDWGLFLFFLVLLPFKNVHTR